MTILIFTAIFVCGILLGFASYKKFSIKKQLIVFYPIILIAAAVLYFYEFGISVNFFAGIFLVITCLFFSTGDIKTRRVSDAMHILVFLTGFAFLSKERIVSMLAGAIILGLIPLVAAVVRPGTFGGADIKFLAAAGWLFGLRSGVLVMVAGLLFSIAGTAILSLVKREKIKRIPMIPYFSLAALIIFSTL